MARKTGLLLAAAGVAALAIAVLYLFWKGCVIPLRTPENLNDERTKFMDGAARIKRIDRNLIYVYFSDWKIKFRNGETIITPDKIYANKPVKFTFAVRQDNIAELYMLYVSITFSTNTEIYSGVVNGQAWQKTSGKDANEQCFPIHKALAKGSEFELPYMEVVFKTPGMYEMIYSIAMEGYQVIEGKCILNVL